MELTDLSKEIQSKVRAFQEFSQKHEATMVTNLKLQVIEERFNTADLRKWNKDTMVNSIYHRVMDPDISQDGTMLFVDTLIYILGRPNFHRRTNTGLGPGDTTQPALLVLNGWLHNRFMENFHDQIITVTAMNPFKAGTKEYLEVCKVKYG